MFDAVDGDGDDLQIGDPSDCEIHHTGHFGLRTDDIAADHGLDQNSAAVEIDTLYVETVLRPDFVALDEAAQNIERAGSAAMAENDIV